MSLTIGILESIRRNIFNPFVLDLISVPTAAAYSLRKLRTAYTGSAIRVRRSIDNAEQNIGFGNEAFPYLATTISSGNNPSFSAVNFVTNKIYVSNTTSNSVTVIDGETNGTVVLSTANAPNTIVVNTVTNKIYVAHAISSGVVTVIDGVTNSMSTVSVGNFPFNIAVNEVTNKIYVTNSSGNTLTIIDGVTNTTTTVSVGLNPNAIAINSVTNKIYVVNQISQNVVAVDGTTNTLESTISFSNNPRAIAVNEVTNKIYVTGSSDNTVVVINGVDNSITTVSTGTRPSSVAVNTSTNLIYVGNENSSNVTVINGVNNTTVTVPTGTSPRAVAINQLTNKIYVANNQNNSVTIIDGPTNSTTTVTAGIAPRSISLNIVTNKVYVINQTTIGTVSVINGASSNTTGSAVLNTVALLDFVGGGNGFVTTWYDQSGNARNATQTTAGSQPRIVSNGAVITEGGRAAILFDGADDGLASSSWGAVSQPFSRHYVGVRRSFAGISHWINSANGIPNTAQYDFDATSHAMFAGVASPVVPLGNNERSVLSAVFNGASSYFSKNGNLTTGNPGAQGFDGVRIGGWYNTNLFCANVAMQELIVVATGSIISTTDRQILERNQGDYYGISFLALDQLSAPAAAAYSLRKLRNPYVGNAIRVRRSTDNAELDIGFAASGDLDATALLTFVGPGDGFVTTLYDQSGNGRNATQTTAGLQPQIVSNGAIETENGRPYIDFAVNKGLDISNYNALLAFTAAVLKSDTSVFSGFHTIFDGSGVGVVQRNGGIVEGNQTYFHHNVYPTAVWKNGTALANPFNLAPVTTPFQVSIQNVGGLVSNGSIGNYDNGPLGGALKQPETIVFSSAPSTTDRQILERNQGDYYTISIA